MECNGRLDERDPVPECSLWGVLPLAVALALMLAALAAGLMLGG